MQTFLPYANFIRSARVLDDRRLGKQRVEAFQILRALSNPDYGWQNHPAVKMWRGYELALVEYGIAMCDEWISRGFKDTVRGNLLEMRTQMSGQTEYPSWLKSRAFLASHRSNLMRKDPLYYGQFGWKEPADLPYLWPVKHENGEWQFGKKDV